MGSLFSLTHLIILSFMTSFPSMGSETQGIKSKPLIDLLIRDYSFKSFNNKYFRTGTIHTVHLPANLSGIEVHTARFRCGSLRRYGAKIKEFHLGIGVNLHPCVERVIVVTQNLGLNWSFMYYDNFDLNGYQIVSPVLGLSAYNAGDDLNNSSNNKNPVEVGILSGENPISVDFSSSEMVSNTNAMGLIPLCAGFENNGKVTLRNQVSPNVCAAMGNGHFGLVIQSPMVPEKKKRVGRWKVAIGGSIGAALGAFLLGSLLIALSVKVKRKARMVEMDRRAYEEEALQLTMVGHLRAPVAPGTRTLPAIEHGYRPPPTRIVH